MIEELLEIRIKDVAYEWVSSSERISSDSKTGIKHWNGHIVKDGSDNYYLTSSWFNENTKTGKASKIQYATPYKVTQKNVGRANETTIRQQAMLEFDAMVKKEIETRNSAVPLPMLAQKWNKSKKYISFPAAVQPKLNGMRMVFDGTRGWSRVGKDIIPECIKHLQFDTAGTNIEGVLFDGELILPGNVLLQETMSAAKKYREGVSDKLTYCVYDLLDPHGFFPFHLRSSALENYVKQINNPNIILVDTLVVQDEQGVIAAHATFTSQKYEGTMIRNLEGKYAVKQRSNDLQKFKDFLDDEFKIVDVEEGGGNASGCAVFVCETTNGTQTFNCTPEGTIEQRQQYFQDKESLVGQYLTIRYQELSKDSVPLFPVGVSIRSGIGED